MSTELASYPSGQAVDQSPPQTWKFIALVFGGLVVYELISYVSKPRVRQSSQSSRSRLYRSRAR